MTRFGFLSTYPPTRCGLATFTESLASAMAAPGSQDARIVRVMDEPASETETRFGTRPVVAELVNGDASTIEASIRALNGFDVVIVQHEYGIYGGEDGDEVVTVLEGLTAPSVVVLHTVLDAPTPGQKSVLERVVQLATSVVVMTDAAHDILERRFDVDLSKVSVIPHGVIEAQAADREESRAAAADGRRRVLTWGLIGPGKGIEWGIRAMAELGDLKPRPEYLVVGKTHPKVLLNEGEKYRDGLKQIATELGLDDAVRFVDAYPDADELSSLVNSADVVLLPYDSTGQVTSGVLVEALAAGKPVVATRFPHSVELLSGGAGALVAQKDPSAMAAAMRAIFADSSSAEKMSAARSQLPSRTSWPEVAARYRALAERILAVRAA